MIVTRLNPASLAEFEAMLDQYARETKQTMRDVQLEQGALLCRDSAIFTPPMPKGGGKGLHKGAFKAGLQSVERDVRKVFVAADEKNSRAAVSIMSNRLAHATRANDIAAFNEVISSASLSTLKSTGGILRKILADPDQQRAFKKARNFFARVFTTSNEYGGVKMTKALKPIYDSIRSRYRGRIRKNKGPGFSYEKRYVTYSNDDIEQFIERQQMHVGRMKSGWYGAVMSLPKPKINGVEKNFGVNAFNGADWVRRHGVGLGYSKLMVMPSAVSLKVGNRIADDYGIASEVEGGGVPAIAVGNRVKQMSARIIHLLQKAVDRANKRKSK